MGKEEYIEEYKRYRLYRRFVGRMCDQWVMTESFDTLYAASYKLQLNNKSPFKPTWEEWKLIDSKYEDKP